MMEGYYCLASIICVASIGAASYFAISHADQPKCRDDLVDRQFCHITLTLLLMLPGVFAVGILKKIGVF